MTRSRRTMLLVSVLVFLVNLPLLHSTWVDRKVERSGTDVTATVVDDRVVRGEEFWVSFTFPPDIDPDQRAWEAQVDEETYDDAVASGQIGVRVLADDPSAYRADGAVQSRVPLVLTLLADLLLVVVITLLVRFGGRPRAALQALALGDVERCAPGPALERIGGEDYVIRGEVLELAEGEVVLDLGNRTVRVLLDGHANAVGHQQPAQVRARLLD